MRTRWCWKRIVNDIRFNVSSIVCVLDNENRLLYASKAIPGDVHSQILEGKAVVRSNGDSYVVVSEDISPAQWKVVVLLSNSELAANTRGWYAAGILFAMGGLILTFVLFFALSRWIVHPFQEMIAVMKQVQNGDLHTRFLVKGNKTESPSWGGRLTSDRTAQPVDRPGVQSGVNQRNAESGPAIPDPAALLYNT
jgi:two-component system sensor histidine kinase YesM